MNKIFNLLLGVGVVVAALSACSQSVDKATDTMSHENVQMKQALQGIWADDGSDAVQFSAEGDSLYYPGDESRPLYFKIVDEQLLICGADTVSYEIVHLENGKFWYHSITGELIKLHRSEYELDSIEFVKAMQEPIALYDGVVKKDSVIMFDGHRYHGYVYINPSTMKVYKSSYNENGMKIEQVFYDNVIHLCVYEGKQSLFARDFTKKDFESMVDANFLKSAVLSDMDFIDVDNDGYWYEASLCIPDEASCYQVYILVSSEGQWSLHKDKS